MAGAANGLERPKSASSREGGPRGKPAVSPVRLTVAAASAPAPPLAKLPNALTIARFLLIPAFVVLLARADGGHDWTAGILFGVAGITDQIDGWLARRWHVESEFGKYADPLADRLMIDAAVIMLVLAGRLPWPALAVIVARDALLLVGTRVVLPRGYEFSVSFLGKAATWVLYAGVGFVIATHDGTAWPLWIFWIGLGMAVGAGLLYVASAWRAVRGGRRMEVSET
jgi:CDP-diacylglycerol--glycerol-3-phosphate 3-phosphatidyltransferase